MTQAGQGAASAGEAGPSGVQGSAAAGEAGPSGVQDAIADAMRELQQMLDAYEQRNPAQVNAEMGEPRWRLPSAEEFVEIPEEQEVHQGMTDAELLERFRQLDAGLSFEEALAAMQGRRGG